MKYKAIDEFGEIRKRRGIAYYHQLYTLLSAALNDGSITAGSALPSESALMERFDVSRNTVRRALGQLEQEKRIIRRRGSGSYARRVPQVESSPGSAADMLQDFVSGKARSSSRLIRVQSAATPEFVRRKDPNFGDKSLLVQRCRSFKAAPFMFSTSYVPEPLGARLTRRQLAHHTVLSALDAIGSAPKSAEQIVTAVLADAFAARHLGAQPAAALLCVHRLVRDAAGRSIEHQTHLFRPDCMHLAAHVTLERPSSGLRWSESHPLRLPAAL